MTTDSFGNCGRSFGYGTQDGDPMDYYGHGTHVAGIIGAVGNNSIGIVGVNWDIGLLAVNVQTISHGIKDILIADIVAGIDYVVSEKNKGLNIRVVNMSLGWPENPPLPDNSALGVAIKLLSDEGIIIVMTAGNDSTNLNTSTQKHYPACFRFENTITVGSSGEMMQVSNNYVLYPNEPRSSFSNYGNQWIDIGAPGTMIYSTFLNNGYTTFQGTSMAVPHVSGAAALLCAAYPNETASQIISRISNGAQNIGVSTGDWGKGILDVWNAYRLPIITTTSLPGGILSTGYNQALSVSSPGSGISGSMTWSISSGSLPTGLSLNSSTGVISGTPTATGVFDFTIKAQNSVGNDSKTLSIVINSYATLIASFQGRIAGTSANVEKLEVIWVSSDTAIAEESVSTDQNGEAQIIVPYQDLNLNIWVKGERTLAVSEDVGAIIPGSTIDVGMLLVGDANGDNTVDMNDYFLFASNYGKISSDAEFNWRADFNNDGAVDLSDYFLFASNFGRTGAQRPMGSQEMSLIRSKYSAIRGIATGHIMEISTDKDVYKVGEKFNVSVVLTLAKDELISGICSAISFDSTAFSVDKNAISLNPVGGLIISLYDNAPLPHTVGGSVASISPVTISAGTYVVLENTPFEAIEPGTYELTLPEDPANLGSTKATDILDRTNEGLSILIPSTKIHKTITILPDL